MRRRTALAALLLGTAALRLHAAPVPGVSYTGSIVQDNEKRVFYVTLANSGNFRARTYSYAGGTTSNSVTIPAGGFDTTLSLYDASGDLVGHNEDGGCGSVSADPVTSFCWDASLTLSLPAGTYTLILTQSDNRANGPALSDGFVYDGATLTQTQFTPAPTGQPVLFWDASEHQRVGSYAVEIFAAGPTEITTITTAPTLPRAVTGQVYTPFTFAAQSGPAVTLTWSVVAGALPPGLSLNPSTGAVTGTATAPGAYTFTIQVTDGIQPVTQVVSLTVYTPLLISTGTLPAGIVGQSYGPANVTASGGSGSVTWGAVGLPANLSLSSSGSITGIPLTGGTSSVTFNATDSTASLTASVTLPLVVSFAPLQITSAGALGEFVFTSNVAGTLAAIGGNPPYTWSSSNLPVGFNLNAATGAFSGAAAVPGTYGFTATVTDSESPTVKASIPVAFSVFGITNSTLAPATTTAVYSQTLTATGGKPPYIFASANLPAGLSISSAGVLSGTPSAVGSFGFTVTVADATKLATAASFNLVVTGPASPLSVPGGALISGNVGTVYSAALQASGGAPPYSWTLTGGALPDGLTLNSAGTIQGTPKTAGTYTFGALATDKTPASLSASFTIVVAPAALSISSLSTFPVGIVGSEYPLQILTASGGTAPYSFAITKGTLPDGLSFANPQFGGIPTSAANFPITVTVTDGAGKTASGSGSITINAAHADLIISQSSAPFALTIGSSGVPTPANVTVRSSVVQQLLNYTVAVTPAAPWLNVTGGGTTPGAIGIAVNSSALSLSAANSPFQTTVNVTCVAPSPCAGNVQPIAVSLNVSAPAPQLSATSNLLSFQATSANLGPASQPLGLQNTGGGTLTLDSITPADSWLTVTGAPTTLQAGPAVPLTVTANSSGLSAGYYTSALNISSSAGTLSVPVTLLISQNLTMNLGPAGTQFQIPTGSAPGDSGGSFRISVAGGGSATWNASVLPGAPWLSTTTPTGAASAASPGSVSFAIDPVAAAALTAQTYYGTIRVTSGQVVDSPLDFGVVLNVTPALIPVRPVPSPAGLVFLAASAASTLPSQKVSVFASSSTALPFQASAFIPAGGSWLTVTPSTGTASSATPGQTSVSVNAAGLINGVYRGSVSYAFSSAAVRTVNVTLVVGATSAPAYAGSQGLAACVPTSLVPTQIGLVDNFEQPAGWPAPLTVFVVNDCGGAVPGAQVIASFSNGESPLTLNAIDNVSGIFSGTWTPRSASPQVTINALATAPNVLSGTAQVTGEVSANAIPLLAPNGVLNIFTSQIGASFAPGTIVQIYGSNLTATATPSSVEPLTTTLGGTSVLIGGTAAPLYYVSPTQINAQLPFELTPGNQYQVQVESAGALSTPGAIQISATAPGIAAYTTTGLIIAQHLDYSLVTENSPAKPGEYVIFYLAGLGATNNPVATGAASPSNPLALATAVPVLTLNGNTVPVAFAGLTPGSVGLYQINFQLPADTADGDLPLVVTQSVTSNTVILPVKK